MQNFKDYFAVILISLVFGHMLAYGLIGWHVFDYLLR